jgi:hypothetical protein
VKVGGLGSFGMLRFLAIDPWAEGKPFSLSSPLPVLFLASSTFSAPPRPRLRRAEAIRRTAPHQAAQRRLHAVSRRCPIFRVPPHLHDVRRTSPSHPTRKPGSDLRRDEQAAPRRALLLLLLRPKAPVQTRCLFLPVLTRPRVLSTLIHQSRGANS